MSLMRNRGRRRGTRPGGGGRTRAEVCRGRGRPARTTRTRELLQEQVLHQDVGEDQVGQGERRRHLRSPQDVAADGGVAEDSHGYTRLR